MTLPIVKSKQIWLGGVRSLWILAYATFVFTWSATANATEAQGNWETVKSKHGVVVEQLPVKDSEFKMTRGTLETNASLFDVLAVLRDVEACSDWLHKCKHGRVISKPSPNATVYYTVIDSPFVLKDRDTYVQSTVSYFPDDKLLRIDMLGVENTAPPHKKRVRVLEFEGSWIIEQRDDKRVHLTYQVHMNPQVSTVGAANSTMATSVYETLRNVARLAPKAPYLNSQATAAELDAITISRSSSSSD